MSGESQSAVAPLTLSPTGMQEMKRFNGLIDQANRDLFHPQGLNMLSPRRTAFLFVRDSCNLSSSRLSDILSAPDGSGVFLKSLTLSFVVQSACCCIDLYRLIVAHKLCSARLQILSLRLPGARVPVDSSAGFCLTPSVVFPLNLPSTARARKSGLFTRADSKLLHSSRHTELE